ncbi:glycosyltransferase family 4 protein [Hydrogenophaga sp.]|uniref:glycosyltransferase family 4 protein n=1 Tax=Hydrogenophaga sp. TaxID=1904254 RepID=UPI003D0DC0E7
MYFISVDWFFCSHFLGRAVAARNAGYEVVVLTHVDQHREMIEAAGFKLIPLRMDRRSMSLYANWLTFKQVLRAYRDEKPSLVHQIALKPVLLGGVAARLCGIRRVVNAIVGGGYALTSGSFRMRVFRPILQLALRLLLNPEGSKVVFENTDDVEEFVRTKQVDPAAAVLIKGSGVDPTLYATDVCKVDPPIVLLGARLLWDKGIGEFVEAANLLRARGINARFVIAGDADPGNRACIDPQTLEYWRAAGVVEFWGFRKDMPDVLLRSTVACLPSYREGLPRFLLEAMAAGLPCVATNVPGCRGAVKDGDNGLLVPARDAAALADALQELLIDPSLRKRMGSRGRDRIADEFSSALIESQTLGLYQQMYAR